MTVSFLSGRIPAKWENGKAAFGFGFFLAMGQSLNGGRE
jgi:hypothetical protein